MGVPLLIFCRERELEGRFLSQSLLSDSCEILRGLLGCGMRSRMLSVVISECCIKCLLSLIWFMLSNTKC